MKIDKDMVNLGYWMLVNENLADYISWLVFTLLTLTVQYLIAIEVKVELE